VQLSLPLNSYHIHQDQRLRIYADGSIWNCRNDPFSPPYPYDISYFQGFARDLLSSTSDYTLRSKTPTFLRLEDDIGFGFSNARGLRLAHGIIALQTLQTLPESPEHLWICRHIPLNSFKESIQDLRVQDAGEWMHHLLSIQVYC